MWGSWSAYQTLAFLCQQNCKRAIYVPQVEKYEAPRLGQVVTLNVGFMERLHSIGDQVVTLNAGFMERLRCFWL